MKSSPIATKEFGLSVLDCLSLPTNKCVGVDMDMCHGGFVAVKVTYLITSDDLLGIANAVMLKKKV